MTAERASAAQLLSRGLVDLFPVEAALVVEGGGDAEAVSLLGELPPGRRGRGAGQPHSARRGAAAGPSSA